MLADNRAVNKTLDDEFEVEGLWWLPRCPDNKVPGILYFKKNDINLKLMGALQENNRIPHSFNESIQPCETIFGQSDYGEELTLFEENPLFRGVVSGFTDYKSEVYDIHSFITGGYFEDRDDIYFYSSTIHPTYLTEWLDERPFSLIRNEPEENPNIDSFTASFYKDYKFNHVINSLEAQVEETYKFNPSLDYNRSNLQWEFISGLSIIAENKKFSWFESRNRELISFLSILIGEGVYFKSITFKGDIEEEHSARNNTNFTRKNHSYFIKQRSYKNTFKNNDILINFREVDQQFPILLDNWFNQTEELKEIHQLYLEILYSDVVHLENNLLSTIQILEIYHRKKYEGKNFDEEFFTTERKKVKGFSRRNLDKRVHKKIMESIAHANNYSLRERLKELIDTFSDDTKLALIGDEQDTKKFIGQLVDTRNYLAHYDPERKPNLLISIDEKFYGIQRLKAIVTMILFIELGIDEDFILNKIEASQRFSYSLAKAKEILNS